MNIRSAIEEVLYYAGDATLLPCVPVQLEHALSTLRAWLDAQPEAPEPDWSEAPNVIWLQWGDGAEEEYVYPSEGVTWCSDQINDTDVRYVRADAQPAERVRTYRIMDDTGELVGVWQLPETMAFLSLQKFCSE